MESTNLQLFIYGTLRRGFRHPAYSYISDNFIFLQDAKVKGKLYDLGDYPGAIPCSAEFYIQGELILLKEEREFGWVMEQLDDYEGLHVERGETALYRRELTTVYIREGTTSAWIYWYNKDVSGKPEITSGDVLEYIQQKKQ